MDVRNRAGTQLQRCIATQMRRFSFRVRTINRRFRNFTESGTKTVLRRLYCRWGIPPRPKELFFLIIPKNSSFVNRLEKEKAWRDSATLFIALYLYTGKTYSEFAKRSVDFLKGKSGYWVNTALKLWNGESVDIEELTEKSDMKIMYTRLDELAVSIIKDYRRREK